MNIMLVSQCSKQALPGTRRILDQFAERKGSRTWLTPITEIGLQTLHQLLRKQARRNTAVACHWIRGNKTELLWIVGNRRKFNREGNVPTDTRMHSVLNDINESTWLHTEGIALLASIAGLFHDFGKANLLFQKKLRVAGAPKSEPIRHEWLSVRLFEAFVGKQSDREWLTALKNVQSHDFSTLLNDCVKDGLSASKISPLIKLKSKQVALSVCWLILTHHRLPYDKVGDKARGDGADKWPRKLCADWNSPQFTESAHSQNTLEDLWTFKYGFPAESEAWQRRAKSLAERALGYADFFKIDWYESTFCLHLARCALMLADHCYSSAGQTIRWQDSRYNAYANTVKDSANAKRVLHQKLDEHCVGVAHYAFLFAKCLPQLRSLLPAVGDLRTLRKPSTGKYEWQNKAYSMAKSAAADSHNAGGFFINMASTGTGKTVANARIAFGLSNEKDGCRFSVLLGLRTLTLQTGDALTNRIGLGNGDIATLVGSNIVRQLHEEDHVERTGSSSAESLVGQGEYVRYEGEFSQSRFGEWLQLKDHKGRSKRQSLLKLLSSPVLVSTIDYIIPATESAKGGRHIAPMLRLLSSDIILDEPDDFGLEDQPALCRLVYWSGMLGGRVILSSATLSPALLEALFAAYTSGRSEFQRSMIASDSAPVCGWVDEFAAKLERISSTEKFVAEHKTFIDKRLRCLSKVKPRRMAALISPVNGKQPHESLADTILQGALLLHKTHSIQQASSGKSISVGLVRMANIKALVAVARQLVQLQPNNNTEINLCVYHSRHPLLRRYLIESNLDSLLNRTNESSIWSHPSMLTALKRSAPNQIFIVLATAVAEVGRDHCYDWAIVEPSSMRSIVQVAGRVMRHREAGELQSPNILLLQQNMRSLHGQPVCFQKPGYETSATVLSSHDLADCLPIEHFRYPGAKSCITETADRQPRSNMVDMEHEAMRSALLNRHNESWPASLWWNAPVRWTYQMQHMTRFRKGAPTQMHALVAEEGSNTLCLERFFNGEWDRVEGRLDRVDVDLSPGVHWWITPGDQELIDGLSDEFEDELEAACRSRLVIDLEGNGSVLTDTWLYQERLGFFKSQ